MSSKANNNFQQFLFTKLLEQKSKKINTREFLLEAYEALMTDKKHSKKALQAVYHKVIDTAKDPILMGKLFGRQGKDYKVTYNGKRLQG